MKCLTHLLSVAVAATVTVGCGGGEQPRNTAQPAIQSEAADTADTGGERESLVALKDLGANVALDEEGRAKIVRLSGPKVTDAELELVGARRTSAGSILRARKSPTPGWRI